MRLAEFFVTAVFERSPVRQGGEIRPGTVKRLRQEGRSRWFDGSLGMAPLVGRKEVL